MKRRDPFKYLNTCKEIIRLAVMLYIRFPLWPRNVEDQPTRLVLQHRENEIPFTIAHIRPRNFPALACCFMEMKHKALPVNKIQ